MLETQRFPTSDIDPRAEFAVCHDGGSCCAACNLLTVGVSAGVGPPPIFSTGVVGPTPYLFLSPFPYGHVGGCKIPAIFYFPSCAKINYWIEIALLLFYWRGAPPILFSQLLSAGVGLEQTPYSLILYLPMYIPLCLSQGYRNKCEFTLSLAADGLATTGFRAARFQAGVPITVESPKDCPQV